MKKGLIILEGIFLLSLVYALDFSAEYDTNVLIKDLDTKIILTLEINNAPKGLYNVYTLSDVSIEPQDIFTIENNSLTKNFTIKKREALDKTGYYSFTYTLHHRDVEKIDRKMTIKITEVKDAIKIKQGSVDYNTGKITFSVINKEDVHIKNLSANFSSLLFNINKKLNLSPFEEKEINISIDKKILEKTKAGNYVIEASFETNEGIKKVEGVLYLEEKKAIVTEEDKFGLISKNYIITKTNTGNTLENFRIDIEKNIFSRLFTSFSIEPNLVEREVFKVKYSWLKERFSPGETFSLRVKTNYFLPIFILILGIVAFFAIKRYAESKVEINKSISPVRTKNDEFALKVKLSIRAKKNLENVTLIDQVPQMLKVYNKFGTIKPNKIDAHNRRIYWNLENLNAGEERFFSYIVYSKIGVVGKFSLPKALAVFEKDGKIYEVNSKKVFFMNEQIKKER